MSKRTTASLLTFLVALFATNLIAQPNRPGRAPLPSATPLAICKYDVSLPDRSFGASGGSASITVTTSPGCKWTAVVVKDGSRQFLSITAGDSGVGNGTVSYTLGQNTASARRTGRMTIAGKTVSVEQGGVSATLKDDRFTPPTTIDNPTKVLSDVTLRTPIKGYADLHTHHMGHLNFDGEWLKGKPSGPIASALEPCSDPVHALAVAMGRKGHSLKSQGNPSFRDWPTWDNIEHQSVYETWLKKAHDEGLQLMVNSFTSFEPLCRALKVVRVSGDLADPGIVNACRDMSVIEKEFNETLEFERTHSWYKIVRTPQEARKAIADGKLAVVLSIEVSNLFDEDHFGPWRQQLDKWFDRGVRSVQIVHEIDNRFGRVATHDPTFALLDLIKSHKNLDDQQNLLSEIFDTATKANPDAPLTKDGADLVQRMMNKKMLIDIAHLNPGGSRQVIEISRQNHFYPVFNSHTYLHETMTDEDKKKTKHIDASLVDGIKRSGGMLGMRTGPDEQIMYRPGHVANTCHGSSRSFAQGYGFATIGLKVPVAFGTDMNGMIESLGPRFASGSDSCSWAYKNCNALSIVPLVGGVASKTLGLCDAYNDERKRQQVLQGTAMQDGVKSDFDSIGFARIDHMNDLVKDLDKLGIDTTPLNDGAENFIRMWERIFDEGRSALPGIPAFKNGRCGTDQSDFACEMSKDERETWAQNKTVDCKKDADCGSGLFCDTGTLTVGANACKRLLTDGSACDRAGQCSSGVCDGLRCITPNSKALGFACYIDRECKVGQCSAAVLGVVNGKCVCSADSDCGSGKYCYHGPAGIGTNECRPKKADGQTCTQASDCAGGACRAATCYTPSSKSMGQACNFNAQCKQGKCSAELLGVVNGKCVCENNADCGSGNYCDKGTLGVGTNSCKAKRANGDGCTAGDQCKSGRCNLLKCKPQ